MMRAHRWPSLPLLIALVAGMLLWLLAAMASGRREAWDAPEYWTVAYPLALLVAAVLGGCFPERPWRWALAIFLGQFLAMTLRNGELGGLWPLGLVLFGVLALPALVLAVGAARLRRRFFPQQGASGEG